MSAAEELADLIRGIDGPSTLGGLEVAEAILNAGYQKIFDGDCGLSGVNDEADREAAEAWMRWANILNTQGDEERNGIVAMKQMLAEFGYKRPS